MPKSIRDFCCARDSQTPDAVDMDIYGAFQLCALGILAAPLTARISRTYFNNPGRNIIFLWFGLTLAGLLSLTVEFLRTQTHKCTHTDTGAPLTRLSQWNYGDTCGLTCSPDDGPFSPMRRDAADNIYVIPAPTVFTLGTATLLSAACCIPPILSMVTMWNKILEINWRARFGNDATEENLHEPIEGTNNATPASVKMINGRIQMFLSVVEAPIFGAAVRQHHADDIPCTDSSLQIIAVLILGERNFFSVQVDYQTEPIASIGTSENSLLHIQLLTTFCAGQWAPIVGTGLALFGSLYVALAAEEPKALENPNHNPEDRSRPPSHCSPHDSDSPRRLTNDLTRTHTHATLEGTRRTVAGWLTTVAEYVGTPQKKSYDDAGFRRGRAMRFPQIPGEAMRNSNLNQIDEQWTSRDPSRAPSVRSTTGERGPGTTRERSNTTDTLQLPSPTYTRPSRDSLNLPPPPEMSQITTNPEDRITPAIVVTPDLGPSSR